METSQRNNGVTETAGAAVVAAGIDSQGPRSLSPNRHRKIWRAHRRFPIRAAQLAKAPRLER
jgi:hypothetical protein